MNDLSQPTDDLFLIASTRAGKTGPQLVDTTGAITDGELKESVNPVAVDGLQAIPAESQLETIIGDEPDSGEAIVWSKLSFNIRQDFKHGTIGNLDTYRRQIKALKIEDKLMIYLDVIDSFVETQPTPLRIRIFAQGCLINLEKDLLNLDLREAPLYLVYRLSSCDKINEEVRLSLGEALKNRMPTLDQLVKSWGITFDGFVLSKDPKKDKIFRKILRSLPLAEA